MDDFITEKLKEFRKIFPYDPEGFYPAPKPEEIEAFLSQALMEQREEIFERVEEHMIINAGQYELYGDWAKFKSSLSQKEQEDGKEQK